MKKNDGGPAFPELQEIRFGSSTHVDHIAHYPGMSLRDWFAGMALISIIPQNRLNEYMCGTAYEMADAMLKERSKLD